MLKNLFEPVTFPAFVIVIASLLFFMAGTLERSDWRNMKKTYLVILIGFILIYLTCWSINQRIIAMEKQFKGHTHQHQHSFLHKHDNKTGLPVKVVVKKNAPPRP